MKTPPCTIEPLESRIAPAAIYSFLDVDGDMVTVKSSKGNSSDFQALMEAHRVMQGSGFRINEIDLTDVVPGSMGEFSNSDFSVSVVKGPHGDGHVDLGIVTAGTMPIHSFIAPRASILELDCGDGTNAIGKLQIASYGTAAPAYFVGGSVEHVGELDGSVGSIHIAGDIAYGGLSIQNPALMVPKLTVGSIFVGGNLQGNASGAATDSGEITVFARQVGSVAIGGSTLGGTVASSGSIEVNAPLHSLSIGGEIVGGSGLSSGRVFAGGNSFTVHGSVIGGSGPESGQVIALANSVFIGGNVEGGTAVGAGSVVSEAKNVTIKGSVIGGVSDTSGMDKSPTGSVALFAVLGAPTVSKLSIGGNLVAGSITAGSVNFNGAVLVKGNVQSIHIGGSVIGTDTNRAQILVAGVTPAKPDVSFNAIGSLTVGGSIEYGVIASGHDGTNATTANLGNAENPDAGIGSVTIGHDFYHSSILAGTNDNNGFGAGRFNVNVNYDTQSIGAATRIAQLGPVVIKGALLDDFASTGDSGFEAEQIKSITVGGAEIFKHGDSLKFFDPNNFVFAQEIAAS